MKLLGKFTAYMPTEGEILDHLLGIEGINYLKNESGTDWYSISWDNERTGKNVYVLADDNGDVVCASDQGALLFPQGFTVYELSREDAPADLIGKSYWKVINGELVPPDSKQLNTMEQKRLLNSAYATMKPLELAVKLDMATDEEKATLEAWERYSVLLSRVDVDNPEWPDKPE
ncbi:MULTISPECIES: tail fiber assembly protein [unclassified Serratia (in: enterobacteria)]|uniref:tail fiber assembly protein n=1 Tax=unclassified Serratia (in: enterobacteria) TaxID=2647522 RepID=UPI003B42CE9B